jgi:hypothetical protein
MPNQKAEQAIERRLEEAGIAFSASTLSNWRSAFKGNTPEAKKLEAVLKEFRPDAAHKLMLGEKNMPGEKKANRLAAGDVLRELDVLLRLE